MELEALVEQNFDLAPETFGKPCHLALPIRRRCPRVNNLESPAATRFYDKSPILGVFAG
jgi:hypothetical protein